LISLTRLPFQRFPAGTHPRTRVSTPVALHSRWTASFMALIDQPSALSPQTGPLLFFRFQVIRHAAEQNRACSRRGSNAAPHSTQLRSSPIT
jgi:hypothetical protein